MTKEKKEQLPGKIISFNIKRTGIESVYSQIPLIHSNKKRFTVYHDKFTKTDLIPQVANTIYNKVLSF